MRYFGFNKNIGQGVVFGFPATTTGGGDTDIPVIGGIPTDYVLRYDFNGDVLDRSINANNGVKSGDTSYAEGRVVGTQCMSFKQGNVATSQPVIYNSNQLSVSFWIRSVDTTAGIVYESDRSVANRFTALNSNLGLGALQIVDVSPGGAITDTYRQDVVSNEWIHVIAIYDRTLVGGVNRVSLFVNNEPKSLLVDSNSNNSTEAFSDAVLNLGSRLGQIFFDGQIQDLRIYNRILSEEERAALFNE